MIQCNLGVKSNKSKNVGIHITKEASFESNLHKININNNKKIAPEQVIEEQIKPNVNKVEVIIKQEDIFPKFTKETTKSDYNNIYFTLIKSICNMKYFKSK